jgi:hypothetical protein
LPVFAATALLSALTRSSDDTPLKSRVPDASSDCRPPPWTSCGSMSTIFAFESGDMIEANKLRAPSARCSFVHQRPDPCRRDHADYAFRRFGSDARFRCELLQHAFGQSAPY